MATKHETGIERLRNFSASLYRSGQVTDSNALNEIIRQVEEERGDLVAALEDFSSAIEFGVTTDIILETKGGILDNAHRVIAKAKGEQ